MTATIQDTQQMVQAGDQALSDLEAKLADAEKRLSEAESELLSLAQAREDRATRLQSKHEQVEQLGQASMQAQGYARIAQGTQREREAVKSATDARKAHQKASKELEALKEEKVQGDQASDAREQELQNLRATLQADIIAARNEIQMFEAGREKARAELGEQQYAALLPGYEERRARVEAIRDQLATAQVELQGYHDEGVQQLEEWQDIQKRFRNLEPQEDSTTRFIEATLHYIDTVLKDANAVNTNFPSGYFNLWELLIIPPQQIRDYPGALEERQRQVQQLLENYRAYLAS